MAQILAFNPGSRARPAPELRKVASRGRRKDAEIGRTRRHLTPDEVERLSQAAGKVGRHGLRDRTMILIAYRHGLRVSELAGLRWDQVDLRAERIHVTRLKRGDPATHPVEGDELRALRAVQRAYPGSRHVFANERGGPLSRSAINKMIARAGQLAGIAFPVTPHMLRHACGFYLANRGTATRTIQAYLGHRSIQHTVRYTALSDQAFRGLWS